MGCDMFRFLKTLITPFWILLGMTGMGVGAFFLGSLLENYGNFPACILCHVERWIFLLGGVLAFLTWIWRKAKGGVWLCALLSLVWCVGSGIGFYHAAIQYHFLEKPSFCHVKEVEGDSLDSQLANFLAEPKASCDQRTLDIFSIPASLYIGVTLLISGIVGFWCCWGLRRQRLYL
jgi:disulfide bond formation protein DsbB